MSALLAVLPHQRTCLPQSVPVSQLNTSMGLCWSFLPLPCSVLLCEGRWGTVLVWELPLQSITTLCAFWLILEQGNKPLAAGFSDCVNTTFSSDAPQFPPLTLHTPFLLVLSALPSQFVLAQFSLFTLIHAALPTLSCSLFPLPAASLSFVCPC